MKTTDMLPYADAPPDPLDAILAKFGREPTEGEALSEASVRVLSAQCRAEAVRLERWLDEQKAARGCTFAHPERHDDELTYWTERADRYRDELRRLQGNPPRQETGE